MSDDPVKVDPVKVDPSADEAGAADSPSNPGGSGPGGAADSDATQPSASEKETIEFSPATVAQAEGQQQSGAASPQSEESDEQDGPLEDGPQDGGQLDDEDDDLDGEPEPEPEVAPAGPIELAEEEEEEIQKDWYILKVQSNRERSIAAALQRKVAIEGIEHLFGQILVPVEKVTEFKGGKKKVVERKLWPGYIAVEMHVNDDTWFAIRETGGIGDFTGSGGAPTPMEPHEIAKILHKDEEETDDAPKLNIKFTVGEKVKVKEGNFENFEGEVATIDEASGKVSVMISIFGRSTPVELEYWQVETL